MQGHIVQLTYQQNGNSPKELKEHFPGCTIKILSNDSSQLINKEPVPLFPPCSCFIIKEYRCTKQKRLNRHWKMYLLEITGLETDRANK